MLKVGITGGIGTGKSVVCKIFETLGIPVLYADDIARWLMEHDTELIAKVKKLLGEEAYTLGKLNRKYIGSVIFNNQEKLLQLNELTHPVTIAYGKNWMDQQTTHYAIKEAALFFESNSHKNMDVMIGITAPLDVRVKRAMDRDGLTHNEVLDRVAKQMDNDTKMSRCDMVIINDGVKALVPQVMAVDEWLRGK